MLKLLYKIIHSTIRIPFTGFQYGIVKKLYFIFEYEMAKNKENMFPTVSEVFRSGVGAESTRK